MIDFNKIVKKLWNKRWKVLTKNDIWEIIDPEKKSLYQSKVDKTIYLLKSQKILLSLKAGVYVVPEVEDMDLNEVDLWEKYYFKLLKKIIGAELWSAYYISGQKALEIHMKNFSIPQKLFVTSRNQEKRIKLQENEIIFRTVHGNFQGKKISCYWKFYPYSQIKEIDGVKLRVSCLELALLEASLVEDSQMWVPTQLLTHALKKYGKVLRKEVFSDILRYKYNMSANRLKELSRHIDPKLSAFFLEEIKQNGGCFVGEWLRNF